MFKKIVIFIVALAGLVAVAIYASQMKMLQFETVCRDKDHKRYTSLCRNVGKRAYSLSSVATLNEKDYGPILGVAWRSKGTIISSKGRQQRRSPTNAYYYIIGSDDSDYQYLRLASETEAK